MKPILVLMSLLAVPQLTVLLKRKNRTELLAFCVTWALAAAYAALVAEGRIPPIGQLFIEGFSRLKLAKLLR